MSDGSGEDSEDSLFVSNELKVLNYDDNTDSNLDSSSAVLTDSAAIGSETKEVGESILL
jgi:hypothetical protein